MSPPNMELFGAGHPLMRLGYKVFQPLVSASTLENYYKCQRLFLFRNRLRLIPATELPPDSLMTGRWFHEGMRLVVTGSGPEAVIRELGQQASEQLAEVTSEGGVVPVGAPETVAKAKEMAIAMSLAFYEIASDAKLLPDPTGGGVAGFVAERRVECRLPEEAGLVLGGIGLVGVLDLLYEEMDGSIVLVDYKTTGSSAVERAKTATFEPQSWIYPILVASLWGRSPKKIVHYIVQKPTIRLKKKETLAEYIARVPEWYKDKQAERPNDPPIVRSEFPVTGPLYPRSKMLMLKEVARACNASPPHLDNFPETGAPYQCKGCAFVALCQSDPVTWVDQIAARFRQRKETK